VIAAIAPAIAPVIARTASAREAPKAGISTRPAASAPAIEPKVFAA
jgi:hypothetical protein